MGLLRGLIWIFEIVVDRAEQLLHDEDAVKAELAALYDELEKGTVDEAEFARREAELVLRLGEIEEHGERTKQRGSE
jgi:hypothetical protein